MLLIAGPGRPRMPCGAGDRAGFEVRVLDSTSGAGVALLRAHSRGVNAVAYSADGSMLASGSGAPRCATPCPYTLGLLACLSA